MRMDWSRRRCHLNSQYTTPIVFPGLNPWALEVQAPTFVGEYFFFPLLCPRPRGIALLKRGDCSNKTFSPVNQS